MKIFSDIGEYKAGPEELQWEPSLSSNLRVNSKKEDSLKSKETNKEKSRMTVGQQALKAIILN